MIQEIDRHNGVLLAGDSGWTTCFGAYNCTKKAKLEQHELELGSGKDKTAASADEDTGRAMTTGADPIWDCPGGRSEPGGWTNASVGGAAPCWSTSYAQINQVYKMLRENYGISNCMCVTAPTNPLSFDDL